MIKAIIFDLFGVLANEGTVSFSRAFYPKDEIKLGQTQKLQDRLNLGQMNIDEYKDQLASLGGTDRKTVDSYIDYHQPNLPLLEYIKTALKPKYKVGILSNSGDDWTKEILGEHLSIFDTVVLSYRVGLIKPDARIYELAVQRLGVQLPEAVFTDDKARYCEGAMNAGMLAIEYENYEQFKDELEKILTSS